MKQLLLGLSFVVMAASCAPEDPSSVQTYTRALTTKSACKMAKIPGTDPSKPLAIKCFQPVAKKPPASLLAKQQQYLAAWKQQAPTWATLGAKQQEAKRRALKAAILGK
jgi:hypothetical protein